MKIYTKNKGITLIALVITIIVLLILAGVALASLSGENGLFKRADEAAEMHEEAAAREKLQLSLANMVADKLTNSGYNENEYLTNKLQEEGFVVNDNVVLVDGWQFEIDRSVPEIAISLGKGEVNEEIKIELSKEVSTDYVKSTIKAQIQYEGQIEYIQIAGEKKENVQKDSEGKYTVSKDVLKNGRYSVYARDTEGKYKYETIEVTQITENMDVDSSEKLVKFREEVNKGRTFEGKTVQLTTDVDLKGSQDNQWIPVGTDTTNFKGTFDGKNHTINGLYINNSESNQGLFKNIDKKATVKNLTINGQMTSGGDLGGIASINFGLIEYCNNKANLISSGVYSGGIVAENRGIIYRCINGGTIMSSDQAVAGIAGGNGNSAIGFIIECINNGNINASSWTAGGITATCGNFGTDAKSYICNSYNTGTVSGGNGRRAGIAGQVKYKGGNTYIYNCYNRGDITGCPDIIGYDGGAGSCINLNSYGADATIEKLNVASEIEQELKDTKLYRSNAWGMKGELIALDWEK